MCIGETVVADFMKDCAHAARLMQPHVTTLETGATIYDRAHALFSIVEQATLALDCTAFWELHTKNVAGDRAGFDELLNEILEVE